jgi:predicted membrane protein
MKQNSTRYLIGLVLILFGILFIFKNFNVPFFGDIDVFQFVIPVLLLYWAYQAYNKGKYILSLILGIIGISILFDSIGLDFLGFSLLEKLMVPGIFIFIGYTILNKNATPKNKQTPPPPTQTTVSSSGYYQSGSSGAEINHKYETIIAVDSMQETQQTRFEETAQSTTSEKNTSSNAQIQRQMTTVFSSQRLFFNKSDFAPGNSYIDATCVFGDLDLIFSKDIHLHIDANVTMADLNFIGHKFGGLMNKFQENYSASDSDVHVYISLSVVFGDVDILHSK